MGIFLLVGCFVETITSECLEATLDDFNMVEYSGEELECKFFLELYQYKNRQYFLLGNHCADVESTPMDCDGNTPCDGRGQECSRFFSIAERLGIVGIDR